MEISVYSFIRMARLAEPLMPGSHHSNPTQAALHAAAHAMPLRQHAPLRACVENPQYRFEHTTGRNRFAPRTPIGNILLRKMIPDAFPLLVREPNHSTFISDRQQSTILR